MYIGEAMKKPNEHVIKVKTVDYFFRLIFVDAMIIFFLTLLRLGHGPDKGYEIIFFKTWVLYFVISILIIAILAYIFALYAYKNYGYELTQDGYHQVSGIFFKHWLSIPYGRIQSVDLKQGPVMRLFDLYSVIITTAGIHGVGKYSIPIAGIVPGIKLNEAEALRKELLSKTKQI